MVSEDWGLSSIARRGVGERPFSDISSLLLEGSASTGTRERSSLLADVTTPSSLANSTTKIYNIMQFNAVSLQNQNLATVSRNINYKAHLKPFYSTLALLKDRQTSWLFQFNSTTGDRHTVFLLIQILIFELLNVTHSN